MLAPHRSQSSVFEGKMKEGCGVLGQSGNGLKWVDVEQGFREAVEPKGHCLFLFAGEVLW